MERLTCSMAITDYEMMHHMEKSAVDKRVKAALAQKFAKEMVEKIVDKALVKREHPPHYSMGETVYELSCYLMSKDEYHEYQELKNFQQQMRNFIKVP